MAPANALMASYVDVEGLVGSIRSGPDQHRASYNFSNSIDIFVYDYTELKMLIVIQIGIAHVLCLCNIISEKFTISK